MEREPEPDDQWFVERVREGDERAFTELASRHAPALVRFARSILKSREAAEDVVQDVLWKIWDSRATIRPPGSVLGYLLAAVRNTALNAIKHLQVEERYQDRISEELSPASPERPDARVEAGELRTLIDRLLEFLPAPQREAVILRYQNQLSYKEGASVMGISQKAFEMHLARGMKYLVERANYSTLSTD